jgi:hypothetical protein
MSMTGKERFLTAMRRGIPDRVPVVPDISNMIPARLTGKPFWEIYLHNDPPLGRAYLDAARKFGFEPWMIHAPFVGGNAAFDLKPDNTLNLYNLSFPKDLVEARTLEETENRVVESKTLRTPHGDLEWTTFYPRDTPPWDKRKLIRDIPSDFEKLQWVMGERWTFHEACIDVDAVGDYGVYAIPVELPVDWWHAIRDGGTQTALLDYFRNRARLEEIFAFYTEYAASRLEAVLRADPGPDEIVFQGSASSLSLISPAIYRRHNLPFLKRLVKMCNEAGVIAHQHTCGRSLAIVEINHAELGLDVMEPLEKPPTGDVNLAEAKARFGDRFALKGNIATIGPLLHGTPEEVEREVIETLEAAKEGGGFILSTGDQVGGNTPLENLEAFIAAGRKYGRY